MSDKPPFFPMYPKDFMGDDRVLAMTTEAIGAYVRLLCAAWVATPPATVPIDDSALARIAGLTFNQWRKVRASVMESWVKGGGRYKQPRLAGEYDRAMERIQKARDNGKKGGRPRNPPDNPTETGRFDLANRTQSSPEPEPDSPPNTNWELPTTGPEPLIGYGLEACGVKLPKKLVVDLLQEFGTAEPLVEALEHFASRDHETRWHNAKNPIGIVKATARKAADGDPLDRQGQYEPFQNWLARRNEEIAAVGGNGRPH